MQIKRSTDQSRLGICRIGSSVVFQTQVSAQTRSGHAKSRAEVEKKRQRPRHVCPALRLGHTFCRLRKADALRCSCSAAGCSGEQIVALTSVRARASHSVSLLWMTSRKEKKIALPEVKDRRKGCTNVHRAARCCL